jgi:NADPH:quinone reductase-like Zn-dependent oxidoreductase
VRAIQFDRIGEPEVLHAAEVPDPHPGPGQLRIAVRAAGVNPVDWKIRGGTTLRTTPTPLPHIPGLEAAGIVEELGEGVELDGGVSVGDEVFGAALAATAEYALLFEWARKPSATTFSEAAGVSMAAETAARGLDRLALSVGQSLLVNGGAGGVGLAAVQLAIARGLRVIATASRANADWLQSRGVEATTYGPGMAERVRALANGGVDGALAIAGADSLPALLSLTGGPERVVSIGDATAAQYGVHFTTGEEGRAYYALEEVATLQDKGQFTMPVRVLGMSELAQAHRLSESGHVRGKLVVVPDF